MHESRLSAITGGRLHSVLGIVGLAVAIVFALTATEAQALVCGKEIKKDVKLKQDLMNCPGDGLVVGAHGITIDLNGHRIDGVSAPGSSGIRNGSPFSWDDVVVKGKPGSRITGFDRGVAFLSADGGAIRGIRVKNAAGQGILLNTSDEIRVRDNRVVASEIYGISISNAGDNKIRDNAIVGPATSAFSTAGIAVSASLSQGNLLKGNEFRGGAAGGSGMLIFGNAQNTRVVKNSFTGASGSGIQVYDGSDGTVVRANLSRRNGFEGIAVLDTAGTGTRVIDNRAHRNGSDGIEVNDSFVQVGDNVARNNSAWGIIATNFVIDLGGNRAAGNGQPGQCLGVACTAP